jgi:hypothetical protein
MVGFTSFSERSGEEAAYTLMRSLSKLMDEAVREQGGVVQSFHHGSLWGASCLRGRPSTSMSSGAGRLAARARNIDRADLRSACKTVDRRRTECGRPQGGANSGPVCPQWVDSWQARSTSETRQKWRSGESRASANGITRHDNSAASGRGRILRCWSGSIANAGPKPACWSHQHSEGDAQSLDRAARWLCLFRSRRCSSICNASGQ